MPYHHVTLGDQIPLIDAFMKGYLKFWLLHRQFEKKGTSTASAAVNGLKCVSQKELPRASQGCVKATFQTINRRAGESNLNNRP
jgi:hypothetical protein